MKAGHPILAPRQWDAVLKKLEVPVQMPAALGLRVEQTEKGLFLLRFTEATEHTAYREQSVFSRQFTFDEIYALRNALSDVLSDAA